MPMLALHRPHDPQDMPDFDPGMVLALQGLTALPDAAVKHMIIISDGDPDPPNPQVLRNFLQAKITVSTVGVGAHGRPEVNRLSSIANATGGQFYEVRDANALPRIFQREARQVTQLLIHEKPNGMTPRLTYPHEMLAGIEALPPITGYVLTTRKQNPLGRSLRDRPRARTGRQPHAPGKLDLRPGANRRPHHRRHDALERRTGWAGPSTPSCLANHPLVDASGGQRGKFHRRHRLPGRRNPRHSHCAGQERRLPELPPDDGHGRRIRR